LRDRRSTPLSVERQPIAGGVAQTVVMWCKLPAMATPPPYWLPTDVSISWTLIMFRRTRARASKTSISRRSNQMAKRWRPHRHHGLTRSDAANWRPTSWQMDNELLPTCHLRSQWLLEDLMGKRIYGSAKLMTRGAPSSILGMMPPVLIPSRPASP